MGLNGVFIIPTGLGCAFGGDAGFNSGVKLLAKCSDNLIVNPNSVNSSDINEMTENCLYVEGSSIDRFLEGKINLQKRKTYNKILMAVNSPVTPTNINSKNAGIWGIGSDVEIINLSTPLKMKASINSDGTAGGIYSGVEELADQISYANYDALAIQTPIECDSTIAQNYWQNGGVNPWGGIEAKVSRAISELINKPVAHAPSEPVDESGMYSKMIVKQSMAPEIISNTYTFCILKGLHKSPKLVNTSYIGPNILSYKDIDFLITPHGCFGRPHKACLAAKIPIIVVEQNTTCFSKKFQYETHDGIIFVKNYLEAAGLIMSMNAGVDYRTV